VAPPVRRDAGALTVRFAVVGHVEWVTFAVVERTPRAGEIVAAGETFEDAAGGGAVAAVQLRKLTADCAFFTSTGDERTANRLRGAHDLKVHAALAPTAQRRAFTHLDGTGERTITVTGDRHVPRGQDDLPWDDLDEADGVYVVGADPTALRKARAAMLIVVSPRACDLTAAAVPIDVLVRSASDGDEQLPPNVDARVVVTTEGEHGGEWHAGASHGRWDATSLPGPAVDAYGCGDSFAAALTFALGRGDRLPQALDLAARAGAACLTGRGPYAAQLTS
jgi:ribokinase